MSPSPSFTFSATIRLRSNGEKPASRHFITVPQDISKEIKTIADTMPRKGRGSVKVKATIGFVSRTTSIFPDKAKNAYILPVKADVRKKLYIGEGDEVGVSLGIF